MLKTFFQHILFFAYNIRNRFKHLDAFQITTIKNTGLFTNLRLNEFYDLISQTKVLRYPADTLVIKEGTTADAFYIVYRGSVSVFSINAKQNIVEYCRLGNGTYFGEQAFINPIKKRNASVKTNVDTLLLKIPESVIVKILQKDSVLKHVLTQIGEAQLISNIQKISGVYDDLQSYLQKNYDHIVTYKKNDIIVHQDETVEFVLIVLEGAVNVSFKQRGVPKHLIVGKGHFIGEISVLSNVKRFSTVTAAEDSTLLRVHKDDFIQYYLSHPKLNRLFNAFSTIYAFPNRGAVVQSISKIDNQIVVTATYKLQHERVVLATVTDNFFLMNETNVNKGRVYSFISKLLQIKLYVHKKYITEVECHGAWPHLSSVCAYILDKKLVDDELLKSFTDTGVFEPIEYINSDIICKCMQIKKSELKKLIKAGNASYIKLVNETGCGSVCGGCSVEVMKMLDPDLWTAGNLNKIKKHENWYQCSIDSPGLNTQFRPGQYLTIQIKVNNVWEEKTFFILDKPSRNTLNISIKKNVGIFSDWFFQVDMKSIPVASSQPRGNFKFQPSNNIPILYLAESIGVIPFLSHLKIINPSDFQEYIHLIYFDTDINTALMEEYEKLKQSMPNLKLTLLNTVNGHSTIEEVVSKIMKEIPAIELYICGTDSFNTTLLKFLDPHILSKENIHVESTDHMNN